MIAESSKLKEDSKSELRVPSCVFWGFGMGELAIAEGSKKRAKR